jgi:3-dehydroquinate dehydratase-2
MNILIINGPNLNLLGIREPEIYGANTYQDLVDLIKDHGTLHNHKIDIRQSNHEGEIIDIIQGNYRDYDGIVINPGAYAHYSYAIYDCLKAIDIPAIEVHISDIMSRESFRKNLVTKEACIAMISGHGLMGYIMAINLLTTGENKS